MSVEKKAPRFRVGAWLPSDHTKLQSWLAEIHRQSKDEKHKTHLHPVLQEFKELIENDPQIFMLFNEMFVQIPFDKDPTGKPTVRSYQRMLKMMNVILVAAPPFDKTEFVGFPINAIFDWAMGTTCGFTAFLNEKVNKQLKKVLNEWGRYLSSPASCLVLNSDPQTGWFGHDAFQAMPNFEKEFKCDPTQPHYGFTSWDNFFTRQFREGIRPVASPKDNNVIVNCCESAPFKIAHHVKARDRYWIKGQPYSLSHMLADDPYVENLVGGTIYQAFLSALSYHRWHSPVNGRIVKAYVVDGAYYSEAPSEGYDPVGPNASQGYITEVATRAMIFIQADNPAIGLMCVLFVGMAEVSSCDITVWVGQHVKKGDELGMFHFGGSTHCVIFGPQVGLDFDLHGQTPGLHSQNILVNARLATVQHKHTAPPPAN